MAHGSATLKRIPLSLALYSASWIYFGPRGDGNAWCSSIRLRRIAKGEPSGSGLFQFPDYCSSGSNPRGVSIAICPGKKQFILMHGHSWKAIGRGGYGHRRGSGSLGRDSPYSEKGFVAAPIRSKLPLRIHRLTIAHQPAR